MSYKVTVIIDQEENWYVARCVENNIASQGKTIDEAMENLREALELYFEDNAKVELPRNIFITTMEVFV